MPCLLGTAIDGAALARHCGRAASVWIGSRVLGEKIRRGASDRALAGRARYDERFLEQLLYVPPLSTEIIRPHRYAARLVPESGAASTPSTMCRGATASGVETMATGGHRVNLHGSSRAHLGEAHTPEFFESANTCGSPSSRQTLSDLMGRAPSSSAATIVRTWRASRSP